MSNIKNIIKETVNNFVTEATKSDRHDYWAKRWKEQKKLQKEHPRSNAAKKADRHDYWAERWKKQKEAKAQEQTDAQEQNTIPTYKKKSPAKKDRHRPGYYREYNLAHPERLERIGIYPDDYAEEYCLGDDECESLGRVEIDPEDLASGYYAEGFFINPYDD